MRSRLYCQSRQQPTGKASSKCNLLRDRFESCTHESRWTILHAEHGFLLDANCQTDIERNTPLGKVQSRAEIFSQRT